MASVDYTSGDSAPELTGGAAAHCEGARTSRQKRFCFRRGKAAAIREWLGEERTTHFL